MACLSPKRVINRRYVGSALYRHILRVDKGLSEKMVKRFGSVEFLHPLKVGLYGPADYTYKQSDVIRKTHAYVLREYSMKHYGKPVPPDYIVEVPCGRCSQCLQRKARAWRARLLVEHQSYKNNSCFVTLSFDPDSLSDLGIRPNFHRTFVSACLQRFTDALRKRRQRRGSRYGSERVRYWFVTEYGPDAGRLHVHGIIFGIAFNKGQRNEILFKDIHECWKFGNVWCGWCNGTTCVYVTKYLTKETKEYSNGEKLRPYYTTDDGELTSLVAQQFIFCSHGLGSAFVNDATKAAARRAIELDIPMYVRFGKYSYPLHSYYKSKLYSESDCFLRNRCKKPRRYYIRGKEVDEARYIRYRNALLAQDMAEGYFSWPRYLQFNRTEFLTCYEL